MTTVGIIAEYNPFHNGHRYQIAEIRRRLDDPTIAVAMSGSFTQRGEPAILDKFIRAQTAVDGGADLVVELPFIFSTRSAQDFARGGVKILSALGIDRLAFGSEVDDLQSIKKAAAMIDGDEIKLRLREKLSAGQSYARALRESLGLTVADQPNAMLAIEYLRALRSTTIEPLLIKRIGATHDDRSIEGTIASASAIRSRLPDFSSIAPTVARSTLEALRSTAQPSTEKLFLPLATKILMSTAEELRAIYGMTEGLEYKLIRAARSTTSLDGLIGSMISRRYTRSRIQRLILHVLTGLTAEDVKIFDGEFYIRPLAFNGRGRLLLRKIKSTATIVTKTAQHLTTRQMYDRLSMLETYQRMLALDVRATDLREFLTEAPRVGKDFLFDWKEQNLWSMRR